MWYQRDVKRLENEIQSMNDEFPEFKDYFDENTKKFGWYGYLEIKGQKIQVRLEYPEYYPHIQPKIFVSMESTDKKEFRRFNNTIHKFKDGSICLFTWDDGEWSWKLEYTATEALYKLIKFFDLYKQGKVPNEHFSNFHMNVEYHNFGCIIPKREINFIDGDYGYANIRNASIIRNTLFVESLYFKSRKKDKQKDFQPSIPLEPGLNSFKWIYVSQNTITRIKEYSTEEEIIKTLHERENTWITEFTQPTLIFSSPLDEYENYRVICFVNEEKKLYQIHTSIGNWDSLYHKRMEEILGENFSSINEFVIGVIGLGSLGSEIAMNLAKAGVKNFILVDNDILLPENLSRHVLDSRFLYYSKVEGVKLLLRLRNPKINVNSINESILEPGVKYDLLKTASDMKKQLILINSTANLQVDYLVNQFAIKNNIIAIYTYCNKNVTMGRILRIIPGKAGCFNCFALSVHEGYIPSFSETNELAYHVPYNTGIPGVGMDILEVATEASRIVLQTILERIPEEIPYPNSLSDCILKVIHQDGDFSPATYYYSLKKNNSCRFCAKVDSKTSYSLEVQQKFNLAKSDYSIKIPKEIRDKLIDIAITSKKERCGIIIGKKDDQLFEVSHMLEDEQAEDASSFGCTRTIMGVWEDLDHIVEENPSVDYIGEWHNHTIPGLSPSGVDIIGMDEIHNSDPSNYPDKILLIIANLEGKIACWLFKRDSSIEKVNIQVSV